MKKETLPAEEKKAADSVEKASDAVKGKAPARKGDKPESKDEPAQLGDGKKGMDKFKEDLDALVDTEATLSEGFRDKASVIFEAAINSRVEAKITELEESYNEQLDEAVEQNKTDLVEKVDAYFTYVVENWMKENEVAVESGLRAEIAENFMNGMKELFVENYVEVPEAKVDLVEGLEAKVEELEEKLNTVGAKNIELAESVKAMARDRVIAEASEGLSIQQADKLEKLAEAVDFKDEDDFISKIKTIKEAYFTRKGETVISEDTDIPAEESTPLTEQNDPMSIYAQAVKNLSQQ